mmetsp:Transcript_26212/g.102633  ORF Transcript_26212/g.102633 Transcript_26212/m.102633 type:complete len:503 (-) Transcript_26212:153-1661(-)|eukprot:CAMPEP_0113965592 /NCGR_PEP_ID=MMETSP0011_2-20120614/7831_1 /TAXON_ID=101924 /ORGANISM="Rhodosorus marinus" /LENGTH=502 /DNA_ID=CAMNT_0000978123 /DNA_START=104 /DNA_END=1612 /DNA_ORIENTATION=- /assembly_acc=CAM_ASM_000156
MAPGCFSVEKGRVAVIGAGVSGVATVKELRKRGIDCLAFEKQSRVGGLWADNYYKAKAQETKKVYRFIDLEHKEKVADYPDKEEICEYLDNVVDQLNLRAYFRFNHEVLQMEQNEDLRWSITVMDMEQSESRTEVFDFLVICTGLFSGKPNVPTFPGQDKFEGDIMHTSKWRSPDLFKGKKVVVVGNGKSALDVAVHASENAESVVQVSRHRQWMTHNTIGIFPAFKILSSRLFGKLLAPYYGDSELSKALHHIASPFSWVFFRLLEALLLTNYRLPPRLWPKSKVNEDLLSSSICLVPKPYLQAVRRGAIDVRVGGISEIGRKSIRLSTGEEVDADVIILGTGWKRSVKPLNDDLLKRLKAENDGIWVYKHIVSPNVENFAFIGHASSFMNPVTFDLQARWLVGWLCEDFKKPSKKEMEEDVENMKKSRRGLINECEHRAGFIQLQQAAYHDDLLTDMGMNPKRNEGILGWIEHYLSPHDPALLKKALDQGTTGSFAEKEL